MGQQYAYESQRGNERHGNRRCYYRKRSAAENLEQHSRGSYQSGYVGQQYAYESQRGNERNGNGHCYDRKGNTSRKIYNSISGAISKVATWGTEVKNKAVEGMKNVITGITDVFKDIGSTFAGFGKNMVEGIWNGIQRSYAGG